MTSANTPASGSRIVSLDQFRGYTVVGMMIVNFLGGFAAIHYGFQEMRLPRLQGVLEHHNTYFSYADSIMPAFHFAVGFALRLTLIRRIAAGRGREACWHVIRRCLGLVILSTVLELAGHSKFRSWESLLGANAMEGLADFFKCGFWETLAIIGITSIWILPIVTRSVSVRVLFALLCAAAHVLLSYEFYFDFLWAKPNSLDAWWGAVATYGLDGGPFGFLMWGIAQLIGSLAYDAIANHSKGGAAARIFGWSIVVMLLGYALSCLTTFYSVAPGTPGSEKSPVAESPVYPPNLALNTQNWRDHLAEAPFVSPPPKEERHFNYWMMCKRAASLSFILFSSGFSLATYAVFVLLSDIGGIQIGLFRTFGTNALAAYVLHGIVESAIRPFAPNDSPWWWVMGSFGLFFGVTYMFVRHLEKHGIFIRM